MKKNCILFGAGGFIGSHVLNSLKKRGFDIVATDLKKNKWIDSDYERFRIYVPRILRDIVMWNFHDAQIAGHMGVRRTLDTVNKKSTS